jgi:hypothetical protein
MNIKYFKRFLTGPKARQESRDARGPIVDFATFATQEQKVPIAVGKESFRI